jgi:hypothetical protein
MTAWATASPPCFTGLVCPACTQPVALIENRLPSTLAFEVSRANS